MKYQEQFNKGPLENYYHNYKQGFEGSKNQIKKVKSVENLPKANLKPTKQ